MAYLVIAVGLLTSLAGGYLLNYGYAIVQVERGWSSVIAGSVFVNGGLVTMGLGLLLRAIVDARRSLVADVRRSLVEGPVAARSVTGTDGSMAYPELGGATIGAIAVPTTDAAAEPSFAPRDVDLYALSIADETLPREPALGTRDPLDRHHEASHGDTALADHEDQHAGADAAIQQHGPGHGEKAAILPSPYPAQPVATTREAAAEAPAMDDWLDRAFSDIDGQTRSHASAESPVTHDAYRADELSLRPSRHEAHPVELDPPRVDIVHEEPIHAEPDPGPADAEPVRPRPLSPVSPPHDSPVIGRYESDDTSYVMYADGSIEAQSPAGVYRFSSMAELKAFIEG